MKQRNNKKFLFLLSFGLTFGFGLVFLFLTISAVQAIDVTVSGEVAAVCGNGIREGSETCDGSDDADVCYNGSCKSDCTCPVCGNGTIEVGETCESDSDCDEGQTCSATTCTCSGVPCFLAGTRISLVNDKSLLIEEVKVGDLVLSYNKQTGQLEPAEVLQTFKYQTDQHLIINNELKVTSDHPLYVNSQWLEAGKIKVGDKLLKQNDQVVTVSSVEIKTGDFLVYNLEVDQNHNYFAEEYLAHNKGCIPGSVSCSYGACIGGFQNGFCSNGCSSWPASPLPCGAVCGNGTIEAGEECDDGNTVPGDGCSATCQIEEGCGDGNLDPGEECDDGGVASGDCCSSSCTIELLIKDVSESSITNTSATISWTTPCQSTDSLLEWGVTLDLADGSASLSGQNYSHPITGLEPSTTYYYRITATAGALQTTYNGSFLTLGGLEICDNGLDDDSDGFCDYPASICSDGSVPGDLECVCTADFVCTPGLCQPNNKWTVTCIDQTVPKCQPDYEYEEDCEICPGVFCGVCQELDEETCTCLDLSNCCGNGICEPLAEDPYTCPADCPVSCLSDWECTDWAPEPCPPSGIQTRECFDRNACEIPINQPPVQRSCSPQCPGLFCGSCQQINIEQCICEELVPCCGNGYCEIGETHEQCPQDCILICLPNWTCLNWRPCQNRIQTRECYDLNDCNLDLDRPPEVRSCDPDCDIACNICQQLNSATCSCMSVIPCCGNHICESQETIWSCPVDCGLPPDLRIALPQCLDGLDNDKDGLVDYPIDTGCSKPYDNSELNFFEVLKNISKLLQDKILDNPAVEEITEKVAAPAIIIVATVNTFATFSFFNLLSYLRYLFTQLFAVLFRRRRKKWGVVYNALTKQPVDLAIVRLYKQENSQLVQSRVTDKIGRYNFLASPGRYYLTVTKPNYTFPTQLLKDKKEDIKYLDLYHGETIEVTDQRAIITVNIPLDPKEDERPAAKIIFQHYLRKIQYALAFSAVPLAAISMAIKPGPFTFSLFGFHCLFYVLFRRLGYQKPPKSWGIIYDEANKKPIGLAVTRIYDKQYNKLLETRVTDTRGRYSFLVDNNVYYLTAEKVGYKPERTSDINLVTRKREEVVDLDIGLERGKGELPLVAPPAPLAGKVGIPAKVQPPALPRGEPVIPPEPTKPAAPPTAPPEAPKPEAPPTAPPPTPEPSITELEEKVEELGVDRESLEELMKTKESVEEIKEDVEEQKEKLEEIEEKIEEVEEDVEEKIQEKKQAVKSVSEKPKEEPEPEEKLVTKKELPPKETKPKPEKPDSSKEFKDDIFG